MKTLETLEDKALRAYNAADPEAFTSIGPSKSDTLRQIMNAYCAIKASAQTLYPRASAEEIVEITNRAMSRSLGLKTAS